MRRLCFTLALIGWIGVAHADDPRAEMTAALTAAIDAHPTPATLPTTAMTKVAGTPAAKHVPPQANLGRAAAAHAQQGGDLPAQALAHQAQAAAQAAAGLQRAQDARNRAAHHPHP